MDAPPFGSTQWSLVAKAGHRSTASGAEALNQLCQAYWFPLYAYARRRGASPEAAQDLTQEFFATAFEKEYLAQADPLRGRFRAFLITSFKHFLAKQRDRDRAIKRGGGVTIVSLDFPEGESRYELHPIDNETPEDHFQRAWAIEVTTRVLRQLELEHQTQGKGEWFAKLKPFLTAQQESAPRAATAAELGISPDALRVAIHRLRRRYGELLRSEIAQTVMSPEEVADEIRALFHVFGKS